jgi:hypothetical protein
MALLLFHAIEPIIVNRSFSNFMNPPALSLLLKVLHYQKSYKVIDLERWFPPPAVIDKSLLTPRSSGEPKVDASY